jgi:hypothetical protein
MLAIIEYLKEYIFVHYYIITNLFIKAISQRKDYFDTLVPIMPVEKDMLCYFHLKFNNKEREYYPRNEV